MTREANPVYVAWSQLFEIGVPRTDHEHRYLVQILNDYYGSLRAGVAPDTLFSTLNRLVEYVESHFTSEEALMRESRYPGYQKHRVEHDNLTRGIFKLNQSLEDGDEVISQEVMEFLKHWLVEHILHTDKKLESFFQEHPIPQQWQTSPS